MRAAMVQATPVPGDLEANLDTACAAVRDSAGAQLVVLPELFLSGYRLERLEPLALHPSHPVLERLGDAARSAGSCVVVGAPERVEEGVANSAFCIDAAGRPAGVYRKTHLFGAERAAFVSGAELSPVALAGVRLGLMICFDVEFPEVARTLTLRGADVLVTISANMAPFAGDHAAFVRARALENERHHLYVNRTGSEAGARFVGCSCAVDPEGRVLAQAGGAPATLAVELDRGGRSDERTRYLAQRRPELYAAR